MILLSGSTMPDRAVGVGEAVEGGVGVLIFAETSSAMAKRVIKIAVSNSMMGITGDSMHPSLV